MTERVPAPPGTTVIVLDRADRSTYRIPVVAFDVTSTIAYPICAIAFGGLLKAERALEVEGYIMDRGFPIPFDSEEAWVQWAMNTTPGEEEDPGETVTHHTMDGAPEEIPVGKPAPAKAKAERPEKARKTFASKSFWSRRHPTDGVLEIVEIEPGMGLPRDSEGFEKIKRDEFAAFKKEAKSGGRVVVILWDDDGPLYDVPSNPAAEEEDEDFGGLV